VAESFAAEALAAPARIRAAEDAADAAGRECSVHEMRLRVLLGIVDAHVFGENGSVNFFFSFFFSFHQFHDSSLSTRVPFLFTVLPLNVNRTTKQPRALCDVRERRARRAGRVADADRRACGGAAPAAPGARGARVRDCGGRERAQGGRDRLL
jgi:hypothetical protein